VKLNNSSFDINKAKKSLNSLFEIFSNISSSADDLMSRRCPYKNAKSRCTAKFECKNQHYINKFGEDPVCTGSNFLDYRSAWITDINKSSR
tara:strand:- start:10 stop:282 length:273 start_codon:yes stop_codon:yes gene_type:complete